MRKFWYRRILIMILVLSVSVGGSYCLLQLQQSNLEREVAAEPSETMVIPGGSRWEFIWRQMGLWCLEQRR